jgi:hypothetical protein
MSFTIRNGAEGDTIDPGKPREKQLFANAVL